MDAAGDAKLLIAEVLGAVEVCKLFVLETGKEPEAVIVLVVGPETTLHEMYQGDEALVYVPDVDFACSVVE